MQKCIFIHFYNLTKNILLVHVVLYLLMYINGNNAEKKQCHMYVKKNESNA